MYVREDRDNVYSRERDVLRHISKKQLAQDSWKKPSAFLEIMLLTLLKNSAFICFFLNINVKKVGCAFYIQLFCQATQMDAKFFKNESGYP